MTVTDLQSMVPKHSMLGMRLDYMAPQVFLDEFIALAKLKKDVYCCVPDVYQCITCYDDPEHMKIVNEADYVFSDSTILQKARGWRHGVKPIQTMLGSKLMLELCDRAEKQSVSIALIGGRNDAALRSLETALMKQFPNLTIAFSYSPPFRELTPDEEVQMLHGLGKSKAQLIFVGLGCPKQERWMAKYKGKINAAMIGVGAAFDTNSGAVKSSPDFVHRLGFEWLFRFIREPRRLYRRYMIQAPRFLWLLFWDRRASN